MSARKTVYYADEWMCEIPGVAGSLAEVEKQLSEGVKSFGADDDWWVEPQPVPSRHEAHAVEYIWVACQRDARGYLIPVKLPGEVHAVAAFNGGGWTSEMIVTSRFQAQQMLDEDGDRETEWLVCRGAQTSGALVLTTSGCRFEATKGGAS